MAGIDPISTIGNLADDIINKIWPDPAQRAQADVVEAQAKVYAYVQTVVQPALAQIEVDKAEAASPSVFIAGWRPAFGWVGAAICAYNYILEPVMSFGFAAAGHPVVLPKGDFSEMMPIITGMLGLGTMRTVEKVSAGVNANAPDHAPQSNLPLPWVKKAA